MPRPPAKELPKEIAAKVDRLPEGIVVTDLHAAKGGRVGARWYFRVRDPVARDARGKPRYEAKAWADYDQGEAWAKTKHAELHLGLSTTGEARLSKLGPEYVLSLKARKRTDRWQGTVDQVWRAAVAAGVDDLKDPLVHRRVESWLGGLKAQRRGQKKPHDASPRLRNQFLMVLNAIIAHAVALPSRPLTFNPLASVKRWPEETRSKRVFTVAELRKLVSDESRWRLRREYDQTAAAMAKAKDDTAAAAKALGVHRSTVYNRMNAGPQGEDPWWLYTCLGIYTGARPTEVRHLAWEHVDWHNGDIVLPASHPGNKTQVERRFPMFRELRAILEDRKPEKPAGPVLPAKVANAAEHTSTKAFQAYVRRCGVDSTHRGPHTLRHNCGALMTAMGVQDVAILLHLGHESVAVSKEYRRSAPAFRNDVKGWNGELRLRADKSGKRP